MNIILLSIFAIGYLLIALEQKVKINKSAIAVLLAVFCWGVLLVYNWHQDKVVLNQLNCHLADIAQILFFLMGAMTIVEIMDSYHGFRFISQLIKAKNTVTLLWIISIITFFLSSFLDNVTTSIIMVTLLQKLIPKGENRLTFSGMIVIAANAGGAWTPIGDVTTTMLWIKGYISGLKIIQKVFIPSIVSIFIPLLYFSFKVKFEKYNDTVQNTDEKIIGAKKVFFIGVGALFMVPILKTVFDLPPYLGVLLGLGLLWVYTDAIHNKEEQLKVPRILAKVDYSSLLFFLGILLAVAALDSAGVLSNLANMLDSTFKNRNIIISLLGIISSIVDNVPLTASTMGMYDIALYPKDSFIWQLIAYCVGTGGSLLIIGSAAGVVVMGMEKIDFSWYIRKVSLIAFIGYLAGIAFLLYI